MLGWVARDRRAGRRRLRGRNAAPEVEVVAPAAVKSPFLNLEAAVAYVGDQACAVCHADLAASFAQHPMARSMTPVGSVFPGVSGAVTAVGSYHYEVERRDGKLFHREIRKDAKGQIVHVEEAEIPSVIGSGTRGLAFLAEREGRLYQSPIAWYTKRETWDLAPGYREENRHFEREITLDCLFCHTESRRNSPRRELSRFVNRPSVA